MAGMVQSVRQKSTSVSILPLHRLPRSLTRSVTVILDGVMIILAMYTLNIAHPGHLLYPTKSTGGPASYRLGKRRKDRADSYAFNN